MGSPDYYRLVKGEDGIKDQEEEESNSLFPHCPSLSAEFEPLGVFLGWLGYPLGSPMARIEVERKM